LFKNSFWGVLSNIFQNILFSIFFIVIARKYSTSDFANYVIANTLYAFVVGFSSLGLGQWFIREILNVEDKSTLTNKFFKIQIFVGVLFFLVNIALAFSLYDSTLIRSLSLLIGINVIFDNVIYVIKFINIAQFEQVKTFFILTIEAVLKFLIACLLFIFPIPILWLSLILILLRFLTLNLFIRIGCSNQINLLRIVKVKLSLEEIKNVIVSNWSFIIIGSVSIVYWRIGNILVSKLLTLNDVAIYEISYKLFSMAEILPVIISSSIYPMLIKSFSSSIEEMRTLYRKSFFAYFLYGLLAYTFVYSFADFAIPYFFGDKYASASVYCKEMFLTILVFPTALLQANVLIAMRLEKLDMWFNIISLIVSLSICIIGLSFYKSLSVVNYAILISFLVFHLIQDIVLIYRGLLNIRHMLIFYIASALTLFFYYYLSDQFNKYFIFLAFWLLVGVAIIIVKSSKLSGQRWALIKVNNLK
jgi:O-antigen/teichoic acid export membrane protein